MVNNVMVRSEIYAEIVFIFLKCLLQLGRHMVATTLFKLIECRLLKMTDPVTNLFLELGEEPHIILKKSFFFGTGIFQHVTVSLLSIYYMYTVSPLFVTISYIIT